MPFSWWRTLLGLAALVAIYALLYVICSLAWVVLGGDP